jgi:hypothetical protein
LVLRGFYAEKVMKVKKKKKKKVVSKQSFEGKQVAFLPSLLRW